MRPTSQTPIEEVLDRLLELGEDEVVESALDAITDPSGVRKHGFVYENELCSYLRDLLGALDEAKEKRRLITRTNKLKIVKLEPEKMRSPQEFEVATERELPATMPREAHRRRGKRVRRFVK